MNEKKISIIIPVRNGGDIFKLCIEALTHVHYNNYEIIVVDDASTDETSLIAKTHNCKYIFLKSQKGPAIARNIGAREANGDILFFVDSDILLPANSLFLVNKTLSDNNIDGVVGILSPKAIFQNTASTYENLYMHYMYAKHDKQISIFYTSAAAIKRDVFEKIKGFDENYSIPGIEDMELGQRLTDNGFVLQLNKEMAVVHKKEFSPFKLLLTNFRKAVGTARLVARKRFQSKVRKPVASSWGFILSIPLTYLGIAGIAASLLIPSKLLLFPAMTFLFLTIVLNVNFLRFLIQEQGLFFFIKTISIFWLNFVAYGLGIIWGEISYKLGMKY